MSKKSPGKQFEESFESSCKHEKIFFFRVRDVYIPPELRKTIRVPKNKYDSLIYVKPNLLLLELKSTKQKSISFDEKIIKQHQIDALEEAMEYDGTIPGFVFNFREPDNRTYFVHILDFLEFQKTTDRKSIPIAYCQEKGIEIENEKLRTKYRYKIKQFVENAVKRFW